MQPQTHRSDLPARVLAFAVFLLGIGLLCLVFGQAWALFHAPVPQLPLPVKPGAAPPPAANIGLALADFARKRPAKASSFTSAPTPLTRPPHPRRHS